jgi:hypothetical protein
MSKVGVAYKKRTELDKITTEAGVDKDNDLLSVTDVSPVEKDKSITIQDFKELAGFINPTEGHLPFRVNGSLADSAIRETETELIATKTLRTLSDSFRAGENLTLSDAAGFLLALAEAFDNVSTFFTQNSIFKTQDDYDSAVEGDGIIKPARFNMVPQRWQDTIPFDFQTLASSSTTFPYVTETNLILNQLRVRTASPVSNVRLVFERLQSDFVTWKTVWENVPEEVWIKGTGGYDLISGENTLDLPIVNIGRSLEIFRATLATTENVLPLKGVQTDIGLGNFFYPFLMINAQDWFFTDLPNQYDVNQDDFGKFAEETNINTSGSFTKRTEQAETDGSNDQPDDTQTASPRRDWGLTFENTDGDATLQSVTFKSIDAHTNVQFVVDDESVSTVNVEPAFNTMDVVVGFNTIVFPQEVFLEDGHTFTISLFSFDGNNDTDQGIGLFSSVPAAPNAGPFFTYKIKKLTEKEVVTEAPEDGLLYSRKDAEWVRDNATDTIFDPTELCVDSENVQAAIVDTTRNDILIVKELEDLPAPEAGVITTQDGKITQFNGDVHIGSNRIVAGANSIICGENRLVDKITSTTTDHLITATTGNLIIRDIRLECSSGDVISFDGAAQEHSLQLTDTTIVDCDSLGTITDADIVQMSSVAVLNTITDGLTFAGTHIELDISSSVFRDFTGTMLDLGTAVFNVVIIEGNQFDVSTGQTGVDGAASSANISIGNEGILTNNAFTNTGTYVSTIDECDIRWRFRGNSGVSDTAVGASLYVAVGDEATTVIAVINTPVVLAGTFTQAFACKFTVSASGLVTYIGDADIIVTFSAKYLCNPSNSNNIRFSGYVQKNGAGTIPISRDFMIADSVSPVKMVQFGETALSTNETVQLVIENNTGTQNAVTNAITFIVEEG